MLIKLEAYGLLLRGEMQARLNEVIALNQQSWLGWAKEIFKRIIK